MNLDKSFYLPFVLSFVVFYTILYRRNFKQFFKWVEDHWFYKKKPRLTLSHGLYLLGFSLLVISLLDFQGKPEKLSAKIPEQKTIIMLDTSSSMLTEDVRPNRFEKAIFLARHFIKKAIGHQISIIVFSDSTKRLVPFTSDMELLDSRVEGLRSLNVNRGGTNLNLAISEAMQYLRTDKNEFSGNILLITDAEETEGGFKVSVPKEISFAAVGVGTVKGGNIPIRDRHGIFRGNKRFNGNEIVSKLDEVFLRKLGNTIVNYNYWIATSYSLPTEQILSFFNQSHKAKYSQGEVTIKDVYLEYVLIPAIVLLVFSYILRFGKSLVIPLLIFSYLDAFSQEKEERKPTPYDAKIEFYKNFLRTGEIEKDEKLKLGELLLKAGDIEESSKIYKETIEQTKSSTATSQINYGTSLLANKEYDKALAHYAQLLNQLEKIKDKDISEFKDIIRKNTLYALAQKKQQEKKQQEQNKKDSNQKKNDSDKNKDSQENENKEKNKEDKDEEKKKQSDKEKNKEEKEKKDGEKDDKDKKDKEKNGELKNKADKPIKRVSKKGLPSLLKQLVNDDRKLQEKLIDASTQQKGTKKDW